MRRDAIATNRISHSPDLKQLLRKNNIPGSKKLRSTTEPRKTDRRDIPAVAAASAAARFNELGTDRQMVSSMGD